jgi:hypothetical protein
MRRWQVVLGLAAATVAGAGCSGESLGGPPPSGTGGAAATGDGFGYGTGAGGDIGTGGIVGSGGTPSCGEKVIFSGLAPVYPDILILMDRSTSLLENADASGTSSKWALLTATVEKIVVGNGAVNWGLMLFGTDPACGTSTAPVVPISATPATAMMIVGALESAVPVGDAPTAAALSAAAGYLGSLTDPSPKYVLLVTDGVSGCASDPATADAAAESTVLSLARLRFGTFVLAAVSPGDTTPVVVLDQMATNGGYPLIGGANAFYTPADDLSAALQPISAPAAGCSIAIASAAEPGITLAISGMLANGNQIPVPEDPNNGWTFTDGSETIVTFNGSACESLKDGVYTGVSVTYQCDMPSLLGHSRPVARSAISSSPSPTR